MQIAHEAKNQTMCRTPRSGFLQKLSPAALADLDSIRPVAMHEAGHMLFSEKQEPAGVFLIREGLVRLSINSSDGKRLSLRVARAGEVLGLAATLSGARCESTAETLSTAKITHISRSDFMAFLMRNPEVYKLVIEEVSRLYTMACEQLRTVGLSSSAPEKLARLLLELSAGGQPTENGTRFRFMLTHEQIGEFIGTSRETVTRTLGSFRLRRLVALDGAMVTIPNRGALQKLCA
jgi:CRP/FNR family transcriptional regulator